MNTSHRFARQIVLPEIGISGQRRLESAEIRLSGDTLIVETAAEYLRAAGAGNVLAREKGDAEPARAKGRLGGVEISVWAGKDAIGVGPESLEASPLAGAEMLEAAGMLLGVEIIKVAAANGISKTWTIRMTS